MNAMEALRIIFGGLFILFVPGFTWSYVFFFRKKIDWIERIALSFGLSIALVPLCIFWLNWLFHMKVSLPNTSLTVCVLTAIPVLYLFFTRSTWCKNTAGRLKSAFKAVRGRERS
jgi:uncharacterized membrane protein